MKNYNIKTFIFLFTISLFIFSSCGKKDEEKIIGKWKMAWMSRPYNLSDKVIWEFKENNQLVQTEVFSDSLGTTTSTTTGSYEIFKESINVKKIKIKNVFTLSSKNGNYQILRLNKNILSLEQRETVDEIFYFNHVEFTKID